MQLLRPMLVGGAPRSGGTLGSGGPEDCGGPGQRCCLPSGVLTGTACMTGECLAGLALCHGTEDCPDGQTCCSAVTFGYSYGLCTTGACPR